MRGLFGQKEQVGENTKHCVIDCTIELRQAAIQEFPELASMASFCQPLPGKFHPTLQSVDQTLQWVLHSLFLHGSLSSDVYATTLPMYV